MYYIYELKNPIISGWTEHCDVDTGRYIAVYYKKFDDQNP